METTASDLTRLIEQAQRLPEQQKLALIAAISSEMATSGNPVPFSNIWTAARLNPSYRLTSYGPGRGLGKMILRSSWNSSRSSARAHWPRNKA